ncbi:hypothetical protein Vretimale_1527 [Volvox reticuliferus]|uniref:Photolyase/cryptochrome alpha/beta domain-containing protein n=2 Tax=Volvox reticuliferus TaxID=1737510 RepID=A0A8J4G245_9CHLO|nr:hypothetical protein Vretimale_1527 [Volvox reticuliferus]
MNSIPVTKVFNSLRGRVYKVSSRANVSMTSIHVRSVDLWWIRRDLRTVDNEALTGACRQADALLPVYCFDPRDIQPRRAAPAGLGVPKLGPLRCRFLLEGLADVQREIRQLQVAAAVAPAVARLPARPLHAVPQAAGEQRDAAPAAALAIEPVHGAPTGVTAAAATRKRESGETANCTSGGPAGTSVGGGSSGGHGGGLVIRFGRPEVILPALLTRVAAHNPQLRHVSLHHHLDLLEESATLEREVAGALRAWGARTGVNVSVHVYWDRTLYHPDDLPYHLYEKASYAVTPPPLEGQPDPPRPGRKSSQPRLTGKENASGDRAVGGKQSWALPPNADRKRFQSIPPVMTNFRKATQSAASVRPSIPAPASLPPLPAPFGAAAEDAGGPTAAAVLTGWDSSHVGRPDGKDRPEQADGGGVNGGAGEELPQHPLSEHAGHGGVTEDGGGLGEVPRTVFEVYDAVDATDALHRLEELVGLDYSRLLPPIDPDGPPAPHEPRTAFPFHAGHDHALRRLKYYVWGHPDGPQPSGAPTRRGDGADVCKASMGGPQPPSLLYFTNTRAQAVGVDNSTKLSPFVSLGCITPRRIHEEVTRVRAAVSRSTACGDASEAEVEDARDRTPGAAARENLTDGSSSITGNSGSDTMPDPAECDWLAMHLCIRDFFIFTVLKEGEAVLDERGIVGRPVSWRRDREVFSRWARGATGLPFVDANMRELAATGWMSNRGRQNVASLLTKDLGLDWRWGAELFESLLLDCDVAVNYCNWCYFAGIGNDPRNRHFKTVTQGIKYDEDAVLSATWLPELAHLPPPLRHQPWSMTEAEAKEYGIVLGRDYPESIVDPTNHVAQLTGTGKRKTKLAKPRK